MSLRRIRLQSSAPLPSFRVWFLVPQNVVDVKSLKLALSTQLPTLKGLDTRLVQLVLEIDGFELFDECSVDLVREGDIITINTREPVVLDTLKRKASVEKATRAQNRRRLSISNKDSPASSSSASESSTSDSSSSDSGTSSSSTDSESETSGSSPGHKDQKIPSNGVPSVARSQVASRVGTEGLQQPPPVPPGSGKASTHLRNKRRKLKRAYAATRKLQRISASAQPSQENLIQSAGVCSDKIPSSIGSDGVLEPSVQQAPAPNTVSVAPMSTLGNKNKRKGFKKAMEGTVPQKLVFDSSSVATPSGYVPTFIPPSEREDLPKNLFVTSVEVNWRIGQRRSQEAIQEAETCPPDDIQVHAVPMLDPDWAAIETAWDKYQALNASIGLLHGAIVAWKAFGLDPVTLTPQASMLHLGKIISVDVENVLVQPLARPNMGCATFGRAPVGEDQELPEQISQPLTEVWSNEWKLISHK